MSNIFILIYIYAVVFKLNCTVIFKLNFNENNFWYLTELLNNNNKSILLFLLLFIFVFINTNNSFNSYYFIFNKIVIIFFIVLIFLYNFFKKDFSNIIFNFQLVNTNLINGVLLIHPILIYLTYITLLVIFIKKINNINYNIFLIYNKKYYIFLISLMGLFLGSF